MSRTPARVAALERALGDYRQVVVERTARRWGIVLTRRAVARARALPLDGFRVDRLQATDLRIEGLGRMLVAGMTLGWWTPPALRTRVVGWIGRRGVR